MEFTGKTGKTGTVRGGLVLSLGGTISLSLRDGRAVPVDNTAALIRGSGMARAGREWSALSITLADSADLALPDIVAVARAVLTRRRTHDAFVVTTGTDTLEEVAYGLACLLDGAASVAVTGATVPPYAARFDGLDNLSLAARTCEARPGRVTVCMNGDAIPAHTAVKLRNGARPAFGCTHRLAGGEGEPPPPPATAPCLPLPDARWRAPVVPLVGAPCGSNLSYLSPQGLDGLVVACPGIVSPGARAVETLTAIAASGVPVVLASRCFHGAAEVENYYPGHVDRMETRGLRVRGYAGLTPEKARIRLALSLTGKSAAPS